MIVRNFLDLRLAQRQLAGHDGQIGFIVVAVAAGRIRSGGTCLASSLLLLLSSSFSLDNVSSGEGSSSRLRCSCRESVAVGPCDASLAIVTGAGCRSDAVVIGGRDALLFPRRRVLVLLSYFARRNAWLERVSLDRNAPCARRDVHL